MCPYWPAHEHLGNWQVGLRQAALEKLMQLGHVLLELRIKTRNTATFRMRGRWPATLIQRSDCPWYMVSLCPIHHTFLAMNGAARSCRPLRFDFNNTPDSAGAVVAGGWPRCSISCQLKRGAPLLDFETWEWMQLRVPRYRFFRRMLVENAHGAASISQNEAASFRHVQLLSPIALSGHGGCAGSV